MNTALKIKEMALPVGNIESYVQMVNQIPMLSAEKEYSLAKNYHKNNDLESARQLVLSHLRFVVKIAKSYQGYGLALADLIQEGNIGLMKAVKRFDPSIGVRLVSFAVHWIKSEIHDFVIKNWRIVKVATTKAQRKLFFKLRSYKKRLGWFRKSEIQSVAKDLGVKTKEVIEMERRLNAQDAHFDLTDADDDDQQFAPAQYLADQNQDPVLLLEHQRQQQNFAKVQDALDALDDRDKDILQKRYLSNKKATLQELADHYQISPERVRQLENKAIKQLKKIVVAA